MCSGLRVRKFAILRSIVTNKLTKRRRWDIGDAKRMIAKLQAKYVEIKMACPSYQNLEAVQFCYMYADYS